MLSRARTPQHPKTISSAFHNSLRRHGRIPVAPSTRQALVPVLAMPKDVLEVSRRFALAPPLAPLSLRVRWPVRARFGTRLTLCLSVQTRVRETTREEAYVQTPAGPAWSLTSTSVGRLTSSPDLPSPCCTCRPGPQAVSLPRMHEVLRSVVRTFSSRLALEKHKI